MCKSFDKREISICGIFWSSFFGFIGISSLVLSIIQFPYTRLHWMNKGGWRHLGGLGISGVAVQFCFCVFSQQQPWRYRTIRSLLTTRASNHVTASHSCSEPKATAWLSRQSRAATTRCAFPWNTASIRSMSPHRALLLSGSCANP